MSGKIVFKAWIVRADLRAEPEARFVFGDNSVRQGFGGQAHSMRGEPNAIGVATKWAPGGADSDYFTDGDLTALGIINADIDTVELALAAGRIVYVPRDGLGTGLSELPIRAPKLHQHVVDRFRALVPEADEFPWGK